MSQPARRLQGGRGRRFYMALPQKQARGAWQSGKACCDCMAAAFSWNWWKRDF